MEENNQTEPEAQNVQTAECPCECEKAPEQNVQETEQANETPKTYKPRKNHRNKNARKSQNSDKAAAVCGEVAEGEKPAEKLSGSHLDGYKPGEGYRPRGRRQRDSFENEAPAQPERSGPAFEKPEFKPRAVEISLDDAPAASKKPKNNADVVSYSSAEEPSVGILSRIKRLLSSIFKKNEKRGFKKNRKDWKGKRRFSNSKGDFKKGEWKNRKNFHSRRRGDKGGFNKRNRDQSAPSKES